jgi:hypothetical protein
MPASTRYIILRQSRTNLATSVRAGQTLLESLNHACLQRACTLVQTLDLQVFSMSRSWQLQKHQCPFGYGRLHHGMVSCATFKACTARAEVSQRTITSSRHA